MQEKRKKVILSSRQELLAEDFVEHAARDGIELEKGAVITNDITVTDYHDGEITLEGPLTGTASYE